MEKDITFASVAELSRMLAAREVSAVELAQHYLARIEAHKDLNAFLDVRPEATLEQARQADERIAAGGAVDDAADEPLQVGDLLQGQGQLLPGDGIPNQGLHRCQPHARGLHESL